MAFHMKLSSSMSTNPTQGDVQRVLTPLYNVPKRAQLYIRYVRRIRFPFCRLIYFHAVPQGCCCLEANRGNVFSTHIVDACFVTRYKFRDKIALG